MGKADAHAGLGRVARERGDYDGAQGHLQVALTLYDQTGYRQAQAITHADLRQVARERGKFA